MICFHTDTQPRMDVPPSGMVSREHYEKTIQHLRNEIQQLRDEIQQLRDVKRLLSQRYLEYLQTPCGSGAGDDRMAVGA